MKGIIGIGNAITDILALLPEENFLKELKFPKGSMQLVSYETIQNIESKIKKHIHSIKSGGSVGNTMYAIASFQFPSAYIGKIGNDSIGNFYKTDLESQGVKCFFSESEQNSGLAIAMITPDSERTFATFLGAASELKPSDINESWLDNYQILHIEGYLVFNKELIIHIANLAKKKNLKISFDLASYNVVEEHLPFIKEFLLKYVDIVFANEEEAKAFCGKAPQDAILEFSKYCKIAVVKVGKNGSYIKDNDFLVHIPSFQSNVIDTTGAGDWYAAGFLYMYCNNFDIEKCGKTASYLAARVIEHIGAKIPEEILPEIIKTAKIL